MLLEGVPNARQNESLILYDDYDAQNEQQLQVEESCNCALTSPSLLRNVH